MTLFLYVEYTRPTGERRRQGSESFKRFQVPGNTRPDLPPPPLWDLDHCPAAQLAQRYADLQALVARLKAQDIPAPACWYTHGWLVHRLAALQAWRTRAYAADSHPRDAAEWWAVGLASLQRDWEPLMAHQGRHPPPDAPWDDPVPIPEFGAFVQAAARERAENPPPAPRTRPPWQAPP